MEFLHGAAEELIRAEYTEMPGLQLTFWQAQRLWNLSEERCERALSALLAAGFLVRSSDGCYMRPPLTTRERESLLECGLARVAPRSRTGKTDP